MNKKFFFPIVAVLFLTAAFSSCKKDKDSDLNGAVSISPNLDVYIDTELVAAYSGTETVTWQWNKDGTAIAGEIANRYIPQQAGSYTVTASAKGYNSKTSQAVEVKNFSNFSGAVTISPNLDVFIDTELTAAYSGTETVIWQWNKDGTDIEGETANKYTPAEAGSYTVTASAKGYNSKTSQAVEVKYFTRIKVTGLEEYNGKYGYITIYSDERILFAGSNWNDAELIVSGTFVANIWIVEDDDIFDPSERWSGYGSYFLDVQIIDTPNWCDFNQWIFFQSKDKITIQQREVTTIRFSDYEWDYGIEEK